MDSKIVKTQSSALAAGQEFQPEHSLGYLDTELGTCYHPSQYQLHTQETVIVLLLLVLVLLLSLVLLVVSELPITIWDANTKPNNTVLLIIILSTHHVHIVVQGILYNDTQHFTPSLSFTYKSYMPTITGYQILGNLRRLGQVGRTSNLSFSC